MRAWHRKTSVGVVCILGLALSSAACGGSDAEPTQPTGVLDATATTGGAMDGSAPVGQPGSDATIGQAVPDGGGSLGSTGGGAEAGANADAGPSDAGTGPTDAGNDTGVALERFSFFVTSLSAMRMLSDNRNGFGGDLRHGETGEGAGLRGADKICTEIAELSMPGAGAKQWRAFLSTTTVHARTRIGSGPWYPCLLASMRDWHRAAARPVKRVARRLV